MCTLYSIINEDYLLRRFPIIDNPIFVHFFKKIDGRYYPTSAAFKTKRDENGLSINIKVLTLDINRFIGELTSFRVAEFLAQIPIENNYECRHDPYPAEDTQNGAHALILGDTKRIAKKLAKKSAPLDFERNAAGT